MSWIEVKRDLVSKIWMNESGQFRFETRLGTVLHYPTAGPDSTVCDGEVDFSPVRVNNAQLDGWKATVANWHYTLGIPSEYPGQDGWVGMGGRQGQNWLKYRLVRCGYLHWPTRAWEDVGGSPTYDRAYLTRETDSLNIGPNNQTIDVAQNVEWKNIWTTPGAGEVYAQWRVEGKYLKEDVAINQAAREWITVNRPPSTTPLETYFGLVFQVDASDIPYWTKAGIAQDKDGDFDDTGGDFRLQDNLGRHLARMPASHVSSGGEVVNCKKRFWKDGDGNHYLLVGAPVLEVNGLPPGDLVFDPDFSIDATAGDTWLSSGNQDKAWGSTTTLAFSTMGNAQVLMKFDVSSIPSGATCNSADLFLYQFGASPIGARDFFIHEFLAANDGWVAGVEEDPATGTQSTWDFKNHGSSTAWAGSEGAQTSGTDYDAVQLGTGNGGGSDGAEIEISLTAGSVQDWWAPTDQNYGVVGWVSAFINCDSNDSVTAGERPKLTVEFTTAAGAIMNQFQTNNLGADLFNGTLL